MTYRMPKATITFEDWPDHWGPRPILFGIPVVNNCPNTQHHDAHIMDSMKGYPEENREWLFCRGVTAETTHHIGRSWDTLRHCEDNCPCPQEPCGLVDRAKVVDSCDQHPPKAIKTMRQSHMAKDCPGVRPEGDANPVKP